MFLNDLYDSVADYLAQLEALTAGGDHDALAEAACSEIPGLITAVRTLIDEHQPSGTGVCQACSRKQRRRWWRWFRRAGLPCRLYLQARTALFHDDTPPPRHALREPATHARLPARTGAPTS